MRRLLLLLLGWFALAAGHAADPRFTVVSVDPREQGLGLFLHDDKGRPFNSFQALEAWLKSKNKRLRFAMNAGMFHADFSPVGLLVIEGQEEAPLNTDRGYGNFFLKPNGVFFVTAAGPRVVESSEYPKWAKGVVLATQSGPLLVRHGVIHPAFRADSKSRLIRNGVGACGGKALFVISEEPVNFHEFASFFRDALQCADALYLDGTVSSLYSTELGRSDFKARLGPILAVVD